MEPWMEDELVSSVPQEKMEFLSRLFTDVKGKSQKELMQRLLPLLKEGREKGLLFSPSETSAIIAAMKKHSGAEENARIDALLKKAKV